MCVRACDSCMFDRCHFVHTLPLPIDVHLFYHVTKGSNSRKYIADVLDKQSEYESESESESPGGEENVNR